MSDIKKTTLHIKGMHCPSCDILVHDKFKEVRNVKEVKANFRNQKAEVYYEGTLDRHALGKKIAPYGYSVAEKYEREVSEPYTGRLFHAGVWAIVVFVLYYFAQELGLVPQFNSSSGLTLSTVFVLGLVASTSTCMATSGALFLATVGKLRRDGASFFENIVPAISFNIGRVLTYTFFGFLTGYVGKAISTELKSGYLLSFFVSLMMILIGLNMLKLINFSWIFSGSLTKGIFQKLENKLIAHPKKMSFLLGAITYLLPCGFTQTVQLYALGLADPVKSSLTMGIFALGTVPALLAVGFASSFTKSAFYPIFYRIMGVVVFMIGVSYFANFMTLSGINLPFTGSADSNSSQIEISDGYQNVYMNVDSGGYSPNFFTVQKGTPVKWIINGENVFGCQGYLVAPKLGIQRLLNGGENIIEFTPSEKGSINFSCGMGMYRGRFEVI